MVFGIFPASGGLDGSAVESLSTFESSILIARNPGKLKHLEARGATLRQADSDESSMAYSVHKKAIDSAIKIKSGVKHILYTSLNFAGPADSTTSSAYGMQAHVKTEAYLRQLHEEDPSFTFTLIREAQYSKSFPLYTSSWSFENPCSTIKIPHSGSLPGASWAKQVKPMPNSSSKHIQRSASFPTDFEYSNRTVLLTGPREISLGGVVEILARTSGTPVTIEEVSVEEFANQESQQNGEGYGSGDFAKKWATSFEGIKERSARIVTDDLEELLGREPETFEVTVARMAKEAKEARK
ncbi:hypothetical protein JCM5353_002907 [Sporobolomyces roseus]